MIERWIHIVLRIAAGIACLTAAVEPARGMGGERGIPFSRLGVNDGLPSNEVSCIYKDGRGFMWFGTGAGLTRFDGYEFRTFRHEVDSAMFSEEYIYRISETADGKLWITYHDGEISVFDLISDRFLTLSQADAPEGIRSVFPDQGGNLLYSTDAGELRLLDYATRRNTTYEADSAEGCISDVVRRDGTIYLIRCSGLIEAVDAERNILAWRNDYLKTEPAGRQFRLFVDSDGEIWAYMNPEHSDGLFRFNPRTGRWTHYAGNSQGKLTSALIRAVEEDAAGNIWIATDHGGINILNKQSENVSHLTNNPFDDESISQNSVICLFRDDTGILWCGTYKNGLCYYHESIFKFESLRYPVTRVSEAGINDFNCVYEDKEGNLWIGSNGHGLLRYNRATGEFRRFAHDPADPNSISGNIVVCLAGDARGNLWIGTYMGGLNRFDGKRFVRYAVPELNADFAGSSVYSLYAHGKKLWIGTLGKGLCCLDTESMNITRLSASDSINPLLSDNIYSISKGRENEILVGTAVGVNLVNAKTKAVTAFTGTKNGQSSFCDKAINAVFIDSRNLLWIGSNNGLTMYDRAADRLYRLDKTTGLPDNAVMSIVEDSRHTLWLGTKNGLLRLAPSRNGQEYSFRCTPYYEDEGIQGRIFNRNSVCHTSANELILGGTNGLTVFNPLHIKYNTHTPEAMITGFFLQNHRILPNAAYNGRIVLRQDICYADRLELSYDDRSFTLLISALDYFLPSKNKFSYKMEGFDKEWTHVDASGRNITYTNLPPGSYNFLASAMNNDGVKSARPAMLHITVKPPFWLASWAIAAYAAVAALFVYLTVKMIARIQNRKYKKDRERIAADRLHEMDEMKLRFFTNVSHEFRTPLTLIMTPLERLLKQETNPVNKSMLTLIHEHACQLLSLVNQLLDFRKIDAQGAQLQLSSGDIVTFLRNITLSFKEISEQKNIHFSFSSPFPSLLMSFDADKVFKIASNLISNAFKFTPGGGKITVSLQLEKSDDRQTMLLVKISDNGIGIAPSHHELIFQRFYQVPSAGRETGVGTGIGLHICREYARICNGSVSVQSEPGKGSSFCLSLPFKEENIHEVISQADAAGKTAPPPAEAPYVEGRPSILIVDDHAGFRMFMQQSLAGVYNVTVAADGEEAWNIALEKLPDMVVADWMMPALDGIELCRRIKNDIRTSHIPLILLTAKPAETGQLNGFEAGADDYIEKPFNMDVLQRRISRIIEYKNRMQQQFVRSMKGGIQLASLNINSLDEQLIRKAISLIEEHVADTELSVEWLSREMGMSRTNFYKKILSITGKTPIELIRTIRMKYAARLLEQGQMRVNEVALYVGINDGKLFRKYFKEEFGALPSELQGKKSTNN
jgi:signal transduction histidine kinase/ligand-binding sensor domain-containing protein/DNA-binding response OmpR family regulator